MKTDLYTKTILTVIAIALTVIVIKDFKFVESARASTTMPAEVDVNIKSVDMNAFFYTKPIKVKIEGN